MKGLAFAFMILNLADGLLSFEVVRAGGLELNSIAGWLIGQGWAVFFAVKIGLAAVAVAVVLHRMKSWPEIQRALLVAGVAVFGLICGWNMSQLIIA